MPAGSKMDLPLAKAEPISGGGSATLGYCYLRTGEDSALQQLQERSETM